MHLRAVGVNGGRHNPKNVGMVRFKNRWLLIEFISCPPESSKSSPIPEVNAKVLWLALKQSTLDNFGEVGWGTISSSLAVKYFSPTTNLCIIRVARDHHRLAWGAVTLLNKINGIPYIPHVVHLAGTIKHAQLAAIKHDREMIAQMRASAAKGFMPAKFITRTLLMAAADGGRSGDSYDDHLRQSEKEIQALQD